MVLHCDFYSVALRRNTHINVILPTPGEPGQKVQQDMKVLYLLHGLHGDESSWLHGSNITRYANEAEYSATVAPAIRGEVENICDGNDATQIQWNNVRDVTFTCELKSTTDIAFVELITGKHSDQFLMKEIHVSVASGSGEFGEPRIQQAYSYGKKYPDKETPNQRYTYKFENLGSASRVKVRIIGDAHCNIMELRIVGK
jgi:hypothetical protein